LRRDLSYLRRTLGQEHIIADRQQVGLASEAALWVDAHHFQELVAKNQVHEHREEGLCTSCLVALTEAVEVYNGELMAGFGLADAPGFDEWLFFERESLQQVLATVLQTLIHHNRDQRQNEPAVEYGRRWLALDPLHEPAHRGLMRSYAWSGQRAAALRQYEECVRLLDDELGVAPEAETTALYEMIRTKRLEPPVGIVKQRRRGAAEKRDMAAEEIPSLPDSTFADPQGRPAHNLPPQPTPFIGREEELAALEALLVNADVRLVTIVGPGGIGKTRLSLAAAERELQAEGEPGGDRVAHGVYFVSLVALSSPDQIGPAIAEVLDFPLESGKRTRTPDQQLVDYLRHKRLLLILDNYEDFLPETSLLRTILQDAPGVRFIVTSREKVRLQSEHLFPLKGLSYPEVEMNGEEAIAQFDNFSAFTLFVERARHVHSGFTVGEQDVKTLIEICRLVEGMPLALELAAGWLEALPIEAIAAELRQNLTLLETTSSDIPERHRHIFAVFDTTWHRLTQMEQSTFAALSTFSGGFTREAAWQVCAPDHNKVSFWRIVADLVGKSLVRYHQEQDRYDTHKLLRQYGEDKLGRDPEQETAVRDRHSIFYCTFLADQRHYFHTEIRPTNLAAIQIEGDNIRSAWEWAATQGHVSSLAKAIDALGEYFEWNGRFQDGEAAFSLAVSELQTRFPTMIGEATHLMASALIWKGVCYRYLGRTLEAAALLDESATILDHLHAQDYDVRREQAVAWRLRGDILQGSDPDAAQPYLKKSLMLAESLGDQRGMGHTLAAQGELAFTKGKFAEAEQLLQKGLRIQRGLNDYRSAATTLELLNATALYQGNLAEAERYANESNAFYERMGGRLGIASGLGRLGITLVWLGKFEEAYQLLKDSLAIHEDLGNWRRVASLHVDVAMTLMHLGRYGAAHEEAKTGLQMAHSIGSPSVQAYAYFTLGWNGIGPIGHPESRSYLEKSTAIYAQIGRQNESLWLKALVGFDMISDNHREEALQHFYTIGEMALASKNVLPLNISIAGIALLEAIDVGLADSEAGRIERLLDLMTVARQWPLQDQSAWWHAVAWERLERVTAMSSSEIKDAIETSRHQFNVWEAGARLLSTM
jgi:predicted ATPase/DNA-binding SARP family transcriptional activator